MKFKIVQTNGYKISEVDLFLRKLNKWQVDCKTKTIGTKLQNVTFSLTNKRGYDPKEVDDYLDSFLSQKTPNQKSVSNSSTELNYSTDQVPDATPTITSQRLRELSPPVVAEIGYEKAEVHKFLNLIADTLQVFEESTDEEIQKIKADQYDPDSETPKLLSADQIRWVLFTVNDSDGYDILAIDAAVNRLSDALEYYWRKPQ